MRRVHHLRDVRARQAEAYMSGAEATGTGVVRWDISGKCTDPLVVTQEGRDQAIWFDENHKSSRPAMFFAADGWDKLPAYLDITVPCRRCDACLRARSTRWALRAKSEIGASPRTWFGTMTLRPHEHFLALCKAQKALGIRGTRFNELSPDEQFQARNAVISQEITKWLKRIRKESQSRLRYCLVAEAHKTGLPHYHILIHERWLGGQITERTLRRQWKLGFSRFTLVEGTSTAWYVCKYLSKTAASRVRASVRYGEATI